MYKIRLFTFLHISSSKRILRTICHGVMKVFSYVVPSVVESVVTEIYDANSDNNSCRLKEFFVASLHMTVYCVLIILISIR